VGGVDVCVCVCVCVCEGVCMGGLCVGVWVYGCLRIIICVCVRVCACVMSVCVQNYCYVSICRQCQ